jgi:hypothetical protein
MQTASAAVRRWYERIATEITHGCRDFIILVDPATDANPECNENTNEAYNAKSKATCFHSYPPQSCYERVDSKYLLRRVSIPVKLTDSENRGRDSQE